MLSSSPLRLLSLDVQLLLAGLRWRWNQRSSVASCLVRFAAFNRLSCTFWAFSCKSVIILRFFLFGLKEDDYDDLHVVQMIKRTDALLLFYGRGNHSVNQPSSEARTQHRKETCIGCLPLSCAEA